jgi:uncharacterized coiled-coil protein SlyX
MLATDYLLTDEFVQFSQDVAKIHAEMRALKTEFKAQWDAFNKKKAELENQLKTLVAKFEEWEATAGKEPKEEEK